MINSKVKTIAMLAVIAALSFCAVTLIWIPVVMFLKYEPKDVFITLGGFIFGPMAAFSVSLVVSVIEMFTISDTEWIGAIMNLISSCAFACTASFIYKKVHSMKGAVLGLASGVALTTALMLLWNYVMTPIYLGYPREAVADMLLPVFLPFNLIKGSINAALILLVYKPIVTALRKARLLPPSEGQNGGNKKLSLGMAFVSILIIATCVLFILSFQEII